MTEKTLRDYRPQHDDRCISRSCRKCSHAMTWHAQFGGCGCLRQHDGDYPAPCGCKGEPYDCSCGLDALLAQPPVSAALDVSAGDETVAQAKRNYDLVVDARYTNCKEADQAFDALILAVASQAEAKVSGDIEKIRHALWIGHGCLPSILYGDDGQRQCGGAGHGPLDFQNWDIHLVLGRILDHHRQLVASQQAEIDALKAERDAAREWAETVTRGKSPCGHWQAYAVTEDKGALVTCLQCRAEAAELTLRQQGAQGWQDISTAPKKTLIILWEPSEGHDLGFKHSLYTHWMPLPSAPVAPEVTK